MLAIQIEEAWLDLPDGAAMNITLNNPAFDQERIGRAYSYPIRLQHTPRNLFITKNRHRIDSRLAQQHFPCKAYIKGALFESGRINFTEGTNRGTEAVFQNNGISLAETLGDMKLLDILPAIPIPQVDTSEYWLAPTDDRPYEVRINGTPYSATGSDNPDALSNLVDEINAVFPGIALHNPALNRIEIAHNDPTIVLQNPLVNLEVTFEYTLGDAAHSNLTSYHLNASLDSSYPVAFPVVYAPSLYGNLNLSFQGYVNYRLGGTPIVNGNNDAEDLWENTFIPFFRARYILDAIATAAGLADIIFDLPEALAASLDALLVWNNYCLDKVYPNTNFGAATFKNGYMQQIEPANHVPDWTALEFINRLAQSLNLHFRFRENRLFFTPNRRQLLTNVRDWTEHTQPFFERSFVAGTGVSISFEQDIDTQFESQFENYVLGSGYNELELPFRPVHASTRLNPASGDEWKTALMDQPGTSEPLGQEVEQEAFRLFFDHGQQEDEGGSAYWLASYDNTDYSGAEVGALSLDFPGADGLYQVFWKDWAQLLFSPTITRLVALPVDELVQIRRWENTKVYIYDSEGAAVGVVRSVQFSATPNGIGIAKVEMQKLSGV